MRIKKCPKCSKYTLKEKCCVSTVSAHPAKFSLEKEKKLSKYRKKALNS